MKIIHSVEIKLKLPLCFRIVMWIEKPFIRIEFIRLLKFDNSEFFQFDF